MRRAKKKLDIGKKKRKIIKIPQGTSSSENLNTIHYLRD